MLTVGDPVPSLIARSATNPAYVLDSIAGRHVVMTFIGGARTPGMAAFFEQLFRDAGPFDDVLASCFLVSNDPQDETAPLIADRYPGIRILWDFDRNLARQFGAVRAVDSQVERLHLMSFVLDPALRVQAIIPIVDPATHMAQIREAIAALPTPTEMADQWAPVLLVPNVIEPALCRDFIAYAQARGVEDSGFMKTDHATGQTVLVVDYNHKRRADCSIEDAHLRAALQQRIMRRVVPAIERAFQFRVTRMERYLLACYDAETGGYFRPHKDNTTLGTAHRRFAVTINLNAEDYDGGDLRFPQFGPRTYRAPTGGAIVFSCSLLHEATPITRGKRYALLPFLYDEAAAKVRLENAQHLADPALRKSVVKSVTAAPGWFEPSDKEAKAPAPVPRKTVRKAPAKAAPKAKAKRPAKV
ncbi:2OG-Fe(II) oxygenase [Sphingobium algorifonticola]|uniref:Redoxin domain-containing protein n=1 Tax=Sphingobium algorifonticola TaxID=2008318 RepID=A0A437J941_9SPHN|nr:2OG-Fe(II) oxygenase [Sphingobium algorifonticola]RVT42017.1 redoxin domain-containing protein [Sphingobium algorifonticola]